SLVGTAAVQSEIANIRDRLQRGSGPPAQGPSGLGAPSGLGYGADWDNPRMGVTRAYQPPPGQPLPFATWVLGFADHESRDSHPGFVDGRTTNTEGAVGGVDYTFRRIFSGKDAFAFGLLSGYADAHITSADGRAKTHVDGPSVGIYGVYVYGGFSVDFNS